MPHSEYWPFTANVGLSGEPSLLQKQLGLMEDEVNEIKMELAAMKRNRTDQFSRKQSPRENDADEELLKEKTAEREGSELANTPQVWREEPARRTPREDGRPPHADRTPHEESRRAVNEEVVALKSQIRDLTDEVEELKIGAEEKSEQLEEYRAKYLHAQQEAEELRRQLQLLDFDNKQVSDQVQVEIQRMKVQFQAKLQELAPLPELLAGARAQLLEARQLQALAEEHARALAAESRHAHDKLGGALAALGQERAERTRAAEEARRLQQQLAERGAELDQLNATLDDYKCQVVRLEEKAAAEAAAAARAAARAAAAEGAAEGAARATARAAERAAGQRAAHRARLALLERQLATARALAHSAHTERDEVRQRLQVQLDALREGFEVSAVRLRALLAQVAGLHGARAHLARDAPPTDQHVATP